MGAEQSQLSSDTEFQRSAVSFFINGKEHNVTADSVQIDGETMLVDYIRDNAGLKGTKYMCREGGCGACVVSVKTRNPNTGENIIRPVNSCLMRLLSCDGWDISTIESLGSTKTSLHPIQQRMVNFSGTQCGYCTPAWIMNMYSVMNQSSGKKPLVSKDIEDCMDGIICRCTGYRPILDAMKSLAVDASEELRRKCGEFDNCSGCPCSTKLEKSPKSQETEENVETETGEFETCEIAQEALSPEPTPLHLSLKSGDQWVKATDLNSLFIAMNRFQSSGLRYRVVAGNTGTGVYKDDGPYQAYVEICSIPLLSKVSVNPVSIILGGAVTIDVAIDAMKKASEMDGFEYCAQIGKHWSRVANTPVRNAGTLAGNLMLKHDHKEFPSDIFLILETIGAQLTIASAPSLQKMYSMTEFLNMDMMGKIVLSIHFPKLKGHFFRSFKITRRYQNAHAYVNAGFLMLVDPKRKFSVRDKPSIVFGGIAPNFVHAVGTEVFFVGKFLEEKTIQGAMAVLEKEIKPDAKLPDAEPMYRKALAQSLLYKFILGIMSEAISPKLKSGGMDLERGLTYGKQQYDTDKTEWPLSEPIPKLEAKVQCTGEAEYTNDIHPQYGELAGALVVTKVANATLAKVDPSEALKMMGVVAFVDAKDIPGANNYMTMVDQDKPDVIFVQDKISYAGQPVGIILAETREIALKAVKMVRLTYANIDKPILTIPAALSKAKQENKLSECTIKIVTSPESPESKGSHNIGDPPHSIKGEFRSGSQFHFTMEPQVAICVPKEDGMDIYAATQWVTQMHAAISACLAMPSNAINIQVRRLGGGFGVKLARATHVAAACAVAANKVQRPVRLVLDIETSMASIGKRLPYFFQYEAGFDDTGKIMSLDCKLFCDTGCTANEVTSLLAMVCLQSCYAAENWKLAPGQVITNTPPNTYCRAPGSPQGIACMEYILDHIAFYLKKPSMEVRTVNLMKKGDPIITSPGKVLEEDSLIPTLMEELKSSADLEDREKFVESFNQNNRWKKRGLTVTPMRWPAHYWFSGYNIFIAVYAMDGTVALSHSGIEMGQGINTKVAQVVALELKIPLTKIIVKPVTNFTGANTALTGGAVTSEHVCYAAKKACEILVARLAPVKEKLKDATWELLIMESHKIGMDLTSYYNTTYADQLKDYYIWGATACEVEIDCLTGEYKIIRVDLINDVGLSMSPEVDIGQVEGAFVMGLGMWLTEKLIHDENTGELLTNRTWDYKPPAAKDIPEDFRVTLMRNSRNPYGVLRSKASGEAPFCMSISAFLAIKQAINAARMDAGNMEWFQLDGPVTPEDIHRCCMTESNQFMT